MSSDWKQTAADLVRPHSWSVVLPAILFALTTGLVAAIAASKHDFPLIAFVSVGGLVGGYLWWKDSGYRAVSTGFYLTAVVVFNFPFVYFVPGAETRTVEVIGAGDISIGAAYALAVWGPVFAIFAGVCFGCGYLLSQRVDGTSSMDGSSNQSGYERGRKT